MTHAKLLASIAHPARRAALERIALGPASADDIAKEHDLPLGVVAYHVRALADAGVIALDHEERRRGAVKHVYRLGATNGLADEIAAVAAALDGLSITLATAGHNGTASP